MLLARALYDNIAESPEELAFRRGDVLSVLEQDASGLQGWWLCDLKGRTGIVPGNRLKIIDSKDAAKLQTRVVTPHRVGNMFVYDSPQSLKFSHSSSRNNDYDVPPSRSPVPPSRTPTNPFSSSLGKPVLRPPGESDYDTPKSARHKLDMSHLSVDHYDVPSGSNRSSTVSVGSSMSAVSSSESSRSAYCESERSSLDLSAHDAYDVPAAARAVKPPQDPAYDTPRPHGKYVSRQNEDNSVQKHHVALRPMEHILPNVIEDEYDVLKPDSGGHNIYNTPRKDPIPVSHTYDTPKSMSKPVSRNCSGDSGIVCPRHGTQQVYDNAPLPHFISAVPGQYDSPKAKVSKAEPEYDTPKPSRTASPSASQSTLDTTGVYDVPPRVTKDTSTGDSVALDTANNRESSGSNDSDLGPFPYDELRMELGAAMEALVSLQHHIKTSCNKLLNFVHAKWRTQECLEPRVYEVKLSSIAVGKAGELFLEFGQGALVNASKSDDKRLTKKLHSAVELLGDSLNLYTQSLSRLNEGMWPLVSLVRPLDYIPDKEDDLDIVIRIAREIPDYVRPISGLVQGNSMTLFKRTVTTDNVPTAASQPETSTPNKTKSPPPPTKPKPQIASVTSPDVGVPMPKFTAKSPPSTLTREVSSESPSPKEEDIKFSKAPPPNPSTTETRIDGGDYDVPKPLGNADKSSVNHKSSEDKILSSPGETDYVCITRNPEVDSNKDEAVDAKVEMRDKNVEAESVVRSKVVHSLFPPPEVRTSGLSTSFKERLEKLQKEAEEPVRIYNVDYDVPQSRPDADQSSSQRVNISQLHPNDRVILQFYASQVNTHSTILINAIEAFLKCIEEKQNPKTFVAYSKFVILAAHKMVYIGDTLTRHLENDNVRNDVMNHAYTLCELLKDAVTATKKAALEYPAVTSVQDMVDRVSEVSVAANGLKQTITRFS